MNLVDLNSAASNAASVQVSFGAPDTAHFGASRSAREMAAWPIRTGSADGDLIPELRNLTGRARDLDRNNGLAHGAKITTMDNVVGTGLKLSPKPNYLVLGQDADWASEWSKITKAHWNDFSESRHFDSAGVNNFDLHTRSIFSSGYTNGSACAIPMWDRRYGTEYQTNFKLFESDRLSNPDDKSDSPTLRGGVEYDPKGRVVAYHVRNQHPGDDIISLKQVSWERIPARTRWGRSKFIHIFKQDRPGQSRGKAKATAVLAAFGMSGKYQLTELQAAIVNSKIAGILESDLTCEEASEVFGIDKDELAKAQIEWGGQLSAGAILNAPIGTKFKSHIPGRPSSAYKDYMKSIAMEIGAGIGLPRELFMRDFSETNYSSARAALIEAWRHFRVERAELAFQWANEVYCLFLEEAIALGKIIAPDFYENMQAYCRCEWLGLGYQPVDELKHAKSLTELLSNGKMTYQRAFAEDGLDWEEEREQAYREAKFEKEMAEKYGVDVMTRPGAADTSGLQDMEEAAPAKTAEAA